MHITICVCTFRRPHLLKRLFSKLEDQVTRQKFTYSIVVADNDDKESAKQSILEYCKSSRLEIIYCVEPRQGVPFARNKAIESATGDAIAFIDDDEFPENDWLFNLHKVLAEYGADGVLGPVRPYFEEEPPEWLLKGKFCDRPEYDTGFVLPWQKTRTGNVLFIRNIITGEEPVFRPEFVCGEDKDLFRRLIEKGYRFLWCNEAVVHEVVPRERWSRMYVLKKALLRGRNAIHNPRGRFFSIIKSCAAIPLYFFSLPFLQLFGHHYLMRYLMKLCDHGGKLLALVGLNPIREKKM